ncbi:MAG: Fatty acid metabolism regulator protein [Dehalococcoidia bacterium]|nr:Fatty acid metabolism regulator protein [Bacillota bacterium]
MSSSGNRTVRKPVTSRGQQTRRKILEAAEEIFGEKGYQAGGVVEITQRAGVALGTFYVYFPDKKTVFIELVKALSHSLRREIAKSIEGISDRIEAERAGFRAFFAFVLAHRNLYCLIRQAEFVDEEIFRWYYRRLAEGYERGLAQAMEAGQIRSLDPECLAHCLMGIGHFVGLRWVIWGDKTPPEEVYESMMNFIEHGLTPPAHEGKEKESTELFQ